MIIRKDIFIETRRVERITVRFGISSVEHGEGSQASVNDVWFRTALDAERATGEAREIPDEEKQMELPRRKE